MKSFLFLPFFLVTLFHSCTNESNIRIERSYGPKLKAVVQDGNRYYEQYFPNDSIVEIERIYVNDQLDSTTEWFNTGELWTQTDYKNGQMHGKHIVYQEDGETIAYLVLYEGGVKQ